MIDAFTHRKPWATLTASALLLFGFFLTGCSQSNERVSLPQSILDAESAEILWVDVRALKPESVEQTVLLITGAVPESNKQDVQPAVNAIKNHVARYREFQLSFAKAGGRGILILLSPSEKRSAPPKLMSLVQIEPQSDPSSIKQSLQQFFDPWLHVDEAVPFHKDWLLVKGKGLHRPQGGTADAASDFSKAMDTAGEGPMKFAFRMTERLKEHLEASPENPVPAAIFHPLVPARSASAAVRLGAQPFLSVKIRFEDDKKAHEFDRFYQGGLVMAQGIAHARLQSITNHPSETHLRRLSHQLHMERVMDKFSLELTHALWVDLAKPAFQWLAASPSP